MRFEVLKPEPVQLVAFDDDHEIVAELPCTIDVGYIERYAEADCVTETVLAA